VQAKSAFASGAQPGHDFRLLFQWTVVISAHPMHDNTLVHLAITLFSGAFLAQLMLWNYRFEGRRPGWIAAWDFTPETLGGAGYWRLAIASLLGLFLEVTLIRWVSSEVPIFAYFKNFVLIACFLGFGLGCYVSRRPINAIALIAPLLLLTFMVCPPWMAMHQYAMSAQSVPGTFVAALPDCLGAGADVDTWGVPALNVDWSSLPLFGGAALVSAIVFLLIALSLVPIGQMVGWHLEHAFHGITGYTVNVLSSIAGTILFTVLCFWYQPPSVWLALAGLLWVVLLWKMPRIAGMTAAGFAICVFLVLPHSRPELRVYWSPYQKLTLIPVPNPTAPERYSLSTDNSWFQQIVNLSPAFVGAHPREFQRVPIEWNAYNVPYRFYAAPPSVLVLGSGMGNDVAGALRNGAGRVVAVEIDPLILKLGRELHFERPYASPRVQLVLDDARNYIQNTAERFDLIVFSLLDSHTTSSHYSNIRIDNYVYTFEALSAARRLLKPDGVFIVKFWVKTPWVAGRLQELLQNVFGQSPVQLDADNSKVSSGGRFYIVGSPQRLQAALANPDVAQRVRQSAFQIQPAALTTDDWPYFYQHEPGLPANVIVLSVLVAVIGIVFIRTAAGGLQRIRWHFFFLGAAFMLLEAQIISKMALLFGTTWIVNSIAISVLLLLIVGANMLVRCRQQIPYWIGYGGVFIALALAWFIPLEVLFFRSTVLKAVLAPLILCLPVFFAGIIFISSFARVGFVSEALGSNLLGALVGGLLESLSLWTGLKSLLLVSAVLYLASALSVRTGHPELRAKSAGAQS
jgi:spermidine synthase